MSLEYAQVYPEAVRDIYGENQTVDFVLTFEGKKLLLNNLRLVGNIRVMKGSPSTRLDDTDEIYIDNMVGIHSVVNRVNTNFQTRNNVENFKNYNRYYSMLMKTTNTEDDMFNGSQLCELKSAGEDLSKKLIIKVNSEDVDFSFKPYFMLNNAVSDNGLAPTISYTETGAIKISFDLARNTDVLFGPDCDATTKYEITNLRLHYQVVPDDGQKQKLTFLVKESLSPKIGSANAVLSSKVGIVTNSCSISFQRVANQNTYYHNNLALEKPPNVKRLEFLFNDNQMNFITYVLEDEVEIIQRYIESFAKGDSSLTPARIYGNKAYGVGTAFNGLGYINLSNQKFTVKVESDISNTDPYNVYMFFHGILEL